MPTLASMPITRTPAQHAEAVVALLQATGFQVGGFCDADDDVTLYLDRGCGFCAYAAPHGLKERHHLSAGVIENATCGCGCVVDDHAYSHPQAASYCVACARWCDAHVTYVATCVCGYASHPEASESAAFDSLGWHCMESAAW